MIAHERIFMTGKRIAALTLCGVLSLSLLSGCDKDFTKGTPFDTSPTVTETVQNTEAPKNTDSPAAPSPVIKEDAATPTAKPDSKAEPDLPTEAVTPSPEVTVEPVTPDAASPSPSAAATPSPVVTTAQRDSFDRAEYWNMTFLIWLPFFEGGSFTGQRSEGTYDYAVFSDVTESEVNSYLLSLKKSGFTIDAEEKNSDGNISYSALNGNSWNVLLSYKDSALTIGSGFSDRDNNDEKEDALYTTTMLRYIPRFEAGTFTSSETRNDDTMYTFATYSSVTVDQVSDYIDKLKKAGYVYAVDENPEGDSIWYIAMNDDRFECQVQYESGTVKIGCGQPETD